MAIAENYEEVLKGKYPAKAHAKKVAEWIVEKGGDKKGTIYLEAQKQKLNEVSQHYHWVDMHARY
jgi:Xaa-Pro dipeptidase